MNKMTAQSLIAKASRGFTLLEAMIALLVLSIGLLGLAGLQASSARLGYEAHMRSITTIAASEIIEKIRMRTAKLSRADRPAIVAQYVGAGGGNCDPTDSSIDNDIACWQENLAQQLPEGQGAIIDDEGDGIFDVQISWYDRETEQPSTVSWSFVAGQ
jgi:type IV pilus assembly protein PilV